MRGTHNLTPSRQEESLGLDLELAPAVTHGRLPRSTPPTPSLPRHCILAHSSCTGSCRDEFISVSAEVDQRHTFFRSILSCKHSDLGLTLGDGEKGS